MIGLPRVKAGLTCVGKEREGRRLRAQGHPHSAAGLGWGRYHNLTHKKDQERPHLVVTPL